MNTTDQVPAKGFAILIKAAGATRHFVPGEGETISITDKSGKELWNFKVPAPIDNPGVIIHQVQIDLLTEREFGHFCQNTWSPRQVKPYHSSSRASPPISLQLYQLPAQYGAVYALLEESDQGKIAPLVPQETTKLRPILLVDDNQEDVLLLKRALTAWGVKNPVHSVYGGKECLTYLRGEPPYDDREQFPLPLLVLLDLRMPDVGGIDVLRWIRQQPALNMMYVTLLSSAEDMAKSNQAYELRADSVLVKPLDYAKAPELAQTIHRLLARC